MLAVDRGAWAIFLVFLRLGCTSFGGPVAHLGYFRDEFVVRRRWITERSYADLIALCQCLPGPSSSQVGFALGLFRGGYGGALAACAGFTLPSAIAMILLAVGVTNLGTALPAGVLHGLKVVAVAVVAQAVWGMARALCPDAPRITIMALAAGGALLMPSVHGQAGLIIAAAVVGVLAFRPGQGGPPEHLPIAISRRVGLLALILFLALLAGLPFLAALHPGTALQVTDAFYRSGALVFGGGHVVLPLLQAETVSTGWVDNEVFLAGYGAAQAVPGPLFSFAAFLGASLRGPVSGLTGGLVALAAIFLPSFLLVIGALPFWAQLRVNVRCQAALMGINAAVVGLLAAALYHPVFTSAIGTPQDVIFALVALLALMAWKLPPWLVVAAGGCAGWLLPAAA